MYMRFLAALLLLPALAQAQMYRWIDDSGKIHYSDQAPPSSAKNVQKKSVPASQSASPPLPYALQQAVKDFPVTLYTAETCDPCVQARELLNKRGVPYKDVGITLTDAEGQEKLKNLTGAAVVPVMTVGREKTEGFESAAYQAALDNAGYPKTSLLPAGVQARQSVKPAEKAAPAATESEGKPAAGSEQAPGAGAPK
jgi:glutaredoxin